VLLRRADGSYNESAMGPREKADVQECRIALRKIDEALGR
jgi:hypothetical protein